MSKEEGNDRACNLELAPGLNNVDYKQDFVRAPMSLHPKSHKPVMEEFKGSYAMKISLGD